MSETETKSAVLTRMVLPDHVCPFGKAALELLTEKNYQVDDRHLTTREEVDTFMQQEGLRTTPLIEIDGEKVGGYDDLCDRLGAPNAMTLA
jgi:glutaredoxin